MKRDWEPSKERSRWEPDPLTKASEAFPDYYEAYYHVGVVETRLGHKNEARRAFQRAIDLSGGRYAWAEFGFGYLLYLEEKPEEAVTIIAGGWKRTRVHPLVI